MESGKEFEEPCTTSSNVPTNHSLLSAASDSKDKKGFRKISTGEGLKAIVTSSYVNVLVVFVPIGIASHFVWSPTITFIMNFLAIIPLAKLLGYATEDIALRTGEVIGGLLNATFGNAVELIISIISLTQNLVVVVQASMLGSILSNLLLVLGMCFWGGGYYHKTQHFNKTVAQTSASLLFISVASLLIPASFYGSITSAQSESASALADGILKISRATSIIMLVLYFSYIFFQLKTHKHLFLGPTIIDSTDRAKLTQADDVEEALTEEDEEEEEPQMPAWMAVAK
ncbi:hypothetical protein G6F57_010854 [Rhizopus arrhizus]|nr:hypothetical protein G6F57_010854 [Rhizopus arrhizus]